MGYKEVYESWKRDPDAFWMDAAQAIDWDRMPSKALFDENAPLYEWFSDGLVNTCHNAVDRHVEAGNGDRTAIIYDSPITGRKEKISFAELQTRVARLAGALKQQGLEKGDRVIIYMPMVPQALEAMLACARLGAVHSVVFGGFASNELAVRIDDAKPKAIIAASCGLSRAGLSSTSRFMTAPSTWPDTSPNSASSCSARNTAPNWSRDATTTGMTFRRAPSPPPASPSRATTPPTSFIPLARPGRPRALSAPPAGTWWH